MSRGPEISVVIPVYGCAECLHRLHARLQAVFEEMGKSYEVVYIDDRSPDSSWPVLKELSAADPGVRVAVSYTHLTLPTTPYV